MAKIDHPDSPLVAQLKGVHLFGFDGAPCSQRVSFALAEKGLLRKRSVHWADTRPAALTAAPDTYTFRQVSLIKHENTSAGFAAIQPNMVVPALVHDGELHIESMDIVAYIDATWAHNPLFPREPAAAQLCQALIEQGKALHVSIRYVSFHWSLGRIGKTDAATLERIEKLQRTGSPEQLAEFYAKFNSDQIDESTFLAHLHALENAYSEQEQRLREDGRPYLTGGQFSMADIIWAIKVMRLTECGYPFQRNYPALAAWYARIAQRDGFRDGVLRKNWLFHYAFRLKAAAENLFGGGIRNASRGAAVPL
jgi:glutathione S-transferase